MKRKLHRVVPVGLLAIIGWVLPPVQAEPAPSAEQLQQEVQRLRQEVQQLRDEFRTFQEAVRRGVVPEEKLTITGFSVEGTSLAKETLDAKLKPLTEKKLTLDELQTDARTLIQEAYAETGVRGVQVVIPPQEITDQPLTVQVVEPKLGFLPIEGNRFFGDKNLRRFFEGKVTTPEGMLVAEKLEEQLDRANRHPDRQIAAVLKPGDEPGVSDVNLKVTERKPFHKVTPFHYSVATATTGTPNVGRVMLSNTFQYTNLFDRDHGLSINWQFRPADWDSAQIVGGSYVVPLGTTGHTVALYGGYSRTETDAVVDTMQITGKGFTVGGQLACEVPEFYGITSKLAIGAETTQSDSQLEFGSFTVIESEIGLLPFYARYDARRRDDYGSTLGYVGVRWNPGKMVSHGDTEDFRQFREEANASFLTYRLGLERIQALPASWTLDLRFDAQYTTDNLIPGEQFRMGGMDSLRGFEQSEISGDRGFKIMTELRTPYLPGLLSRVFDQREVMQLVGFFGYGLGRLVDPIAGDPGETDGAGAGFGLRYQFTDYFAGRIDVAWALTDAAMTQRGDSTIYFSAQLSF